MTTNIELEFLIDYLNLKRFSKDIIMKEDLKLFEEDIYFQIVNLGNRNTQGTHWVCYLKIYNCILYFDSFGIGSFQSLRTLCEDNGIDLYYSSKVEQGFNEFNCGERCVEFILKIFKILKI